MANKKSYSRYFIILQEDEKGHSISPEKQSSGYAKIEMKNDKCKVSFYVQNIKREKVSCYMFLIANKKDCKKIINLGLLNIDDNGRADITYECTADNIGDSNISMDKVGGAAIGKFIGGKPVFVMSGFASTEIPDKWKEYSILDCKKKEVKVEIKEEIKTEIKTEIKEEVTEKKSEEKKESKEKKAEDNKEKKEKKCDLEDENRAEDTVEEKKEEKETASKEEKEILEADAGEKKVVEEVVKEETIDVTAKIYSPPVQREKSEENNEFDEYERSIEKSKPESERKDKENNEKVNKDTKKNEESKENKDTKKDNKEMPKDTAGEFFKSIMDGFEEMKGVCSEIKNCKWYKIPVKDLEAMCNISNYNKYTVVYYPMINYYPYIKKYGYYMMGLKCDSEGNLKYLAYGLPGTKNKEEQPYSGRTGFVTWAPITSDETHESHIGYWIMFYDFKNSIIVVPMK